MKKLITFFFVLLLAFPLSLIAEDANTLYHTGAQAYIGGNIADALTSVELGLALEPEHPELRTLYEKLKEEQEKQQQQQNQEQQEQEKQEQEQQEQEQQEQEQQEQEQQEQEQKEQEQKEQEQQDQKQQDKDKQDQEQQPKPQPAEEEKKEISKEEAERILQALRSKEKENKNLRKPKGRAKGKVAKDW